MPHTTERIVVLKGAAGLVVGSVEPYSPWSGDERRAVSSDMSGLVLVVNGRETRTRPAGTE